MKAASSLPDDVLQQIDRLARRLNRSRSARCAEAVVECFRHARAAVADVLDGAARESLMTPPP